MEEYFFGQYPVRRPYDRTYEKWLGHSPSTRLGHIRGLEKRILEVSGCSGAQVPQKQESKR